jgi:hypothetical protein
MMLFDGIIAHLQNIKLPEMELFVMCVYRLNCKLMFIYSIIFTWHVTGNVILT